MRSRMDRPICMCKRCPKIPREDRDGADLEICSIVGKGNHSVNHIQKIKPRVEQVCQELGLQYATEENAGRMYINLQGGPATIPPKNSYQPGGQHGGNYQGGQQQNNNQNEELEKLAMKFLPKLLKKLDGCCVVM
jgi:hypothetical protein